MYVAIICEKPSAARNFAKALGGNEGTYNGEEYKIVSSVGHIFELRKPDTNVASDKSGRYRSWNIGYLPWDAADFLWKKQLDPGKKDVYERIKQVVEGAGEAVIAGDDDPDTSEGTLLCVESLEAMGWNGKTSRMYFADETPKEIQKAFVQRKEVPMPFTAWDEYNKSISRERFDYMTMEWSRVARHYSLTKGHDMIPRQGRLKSTMVYMVGKQLAERAAYVKSSEFEPRYKDENGHIYKCKEPDRAPTAEEVDLSKLQESTITVGKTTKKQQAPGKLLDLLGLTSILAPKGYKPKEILDTYQKMYQRDFVSYPRTEDKVISPEQFNEMLPLIDPIADLVGVDKSLLTHRTPRKTHVQPGKAHGANRPGKTVPTSLDQLNQFGRAAQEIYTTLATNFLAMFGENYVYKHQEGYVTDHPEFTGYANIPVSQGYRAIFDTESQTSEDKEEEIALPLGNKASAYAHEVVKKKPPAPTIKWLMKQLEKYSIGSGATRTSTIAAVTNDKMKDKARFQLMAEKKGKLTLTPCGEVSYALIKDCYIASPKVTERLLQAINAVGKGEKTVDEVIALVEPMIRHDMAAIARNSEELEQGKSQQKAYKERAGGQATGALAEALADAGAAPGSSPGAAGSDSTSAPAGSDSNAAPAGSPADAQASAAAGPMITFARQWADHRFTDDEVARLLAGQIIAFRAKGKSGKDFGVRGKLEQQEYQGRKYWGFNIVEFMNHEFRGHAFTDAELQALSDGKQILCNNFWSANKGVPYSALVRLKNGRLEMEFPKK